MIRAGAEGRRMSFAQVYETASTWVTGHLPVAVGGGVAFVVTRQVVAPVRQAARAQRRRRIRRH